MNSFSFMKHPHQWKQFIYVFGGTLLILNLLKNNVHIVRNNSDSLPFKSFIHLTNKKPKKGDYTLVDSLWYETKLIKKVVGIAGDRISYTAKGELKVADLIVGSQKTKSKDGRHLTPLKAQIIPEGQVFLYAPHPSSFDSRYEELGLTPIEALQGTAYPVGGGNPNE
ncbi:MAG: S26 family signal peptidase [Candidatus Paracaedibacteraceae bacterium]|nr:S26 family signal peptidase [Candidatus Paracaedibacteraceae bacterium]